jgi:hypothetical protein
MPRINEKMMLMPIQSSSLCLWFLTKILQITWKHKLYPPPSMNKFANSSNFWVSGVSWSSFATTWIYIWIFPISIAIFIFVTTHTHTHTHTCAICDNSTYKHHALFSLQLNVFIKPSLNFTPHQSLHSQNDKRCDNRFNENQLLCLLISCLHLIEP